jgi:hypothetical protein
MNKRGSTGSLSPQESSDPLGTARRKRAELEREVGRLQRELDLVKGRSEGKIESLESNLERATLSLTHLKTELDNVTALSTKQAAELHALQDNIIDQANEISSLKTKLRLMDQELVRKDKDAKNLMATMRRYKTRIEYLRSKMMKYHRRASKSDEDDGSVTMNGSVLTLNDYSPTGAPASVLGSSVADRSFTANGGGGRRDSIPFPGYMTAEEEYFRLVVMAAKLNVAGSTTPSTIHDEDSVSISPPASDITGAAENEVREQDIDAKIMYERLQAERVPFHKWHDWAQDYVIAHRMPGLVGMDSGLCLSGIGDVPKKKKKGLAKALAQKLIKMFPKRNKKRSSIGIAAGGDGLDY